MALAPNPSTPDATPAQTDEAFYRDALHSLITVGTNLARNLNDRATAPAPQQPAQQSPPQPPLTPEAAIAAFDRLARAVRRCIALARSLNDPSRPAPDPVRHRTAARKQILREVEDTIGREAHEGDRADALHAELRDRLDDPDLDGDLDARPLPEIIAEICRDLGLAGLPGTQPWKRRTPTDLADLHARATAPSRPPAPLPMPRAPGPGGVPGQPASPPAPSPAAPITRPAPAWNGGASPEDPASLVAAILRHPACARDRWRPPPGG